MNMTYNDITSAPSKEVKVLTKALPASVENIVATTNIAKKIKLTWNKTSAEDFKVYNVYRARSLSGDFSGNYDLLMQTKETQFIDDIQEDGKDYFYRVSVVDTDNLESIYDIKSIHGKTLAKPITPSLVGVKMVNNNLEINWNSVDSRVKSFVVEKTIKKSWVNSTTEEFVDIQGKRFIDTKVEPKTTYYYKVFSVDAFSIRSEASLEVKFTTKENQGRVIKKEEIVQEMKEVKVAPRKVKVIEEVIEFEVVPEVKSVVTPMDDMSVSDL